MKIGYARVSSIGQNLDSQINSAISMQADGMTGNEIADFFSVGRSTLLRNIKEFKERRS